MSRDTARRYLVAYDIADDRRRTQVAHVLASYGDRVQFSVFVIDSRPAKLVRLRSRLAGMIDPDSDSVLLCDLGPLLADPAARFDVLGRRRPITQAEVLIL
jgi:CRISPR-associated protein Cas2